MNLVFLIQFYVLSFCVNLFALFAYFIYYSDYLTSKFHNKLQNEYDFIIVGSGTAGSLIAHRIAKETNYSFIVLEAGSISHAFLEIPVLGPLLHGSIHDWQFESIPQKAACLAMKDNKCQLTQGKIVGGSSKLNNMIHVRGNTSHYTDWFQGMYDEDYIKKQFDFIENEIFHIHDILHDSALSDAILNAATELRYNSIDKHFKEGFMKAKLTQRDGKRWTVSDNIDASKYIVSHSLVDKLLFVGKKCVGVKMHYFNEERELYARKGVIIAAGAYNSPKILQLSGIGPSDLLRSLNIPVIQNLPVGRNLQDHIGSGLDLVLLNETLSLGPFNFFDPFHLYQYFVTGVGPFTSPGCEAVGFLSTKNDTVPDLQFMVLPVGLSTDFGSNLKNILNLKTNVWVNYFAKLFDKNAATIFATNLHPKSRGEVYITSKDPKKNPKIDPKYLTNREDIDVFVNGFKLVKKFIETDAMKDIGAYMNPEHFPGCEKYALFSDLYWECYVRQLTLTSYHPVGTCSMGLPHSKESVVDTSFKVIGFKNLYVADSSVLPTLPSGNINAAVALMASIFFDSNIKVRNSRNIDRNEMFCYKDSIFLGTCSIFEH